MDSTYFLLTNLSNDDSSHPLLHKLSCPRVNAEVFVFVADFEKLKRFREEFPIVNFILLDTAKNPELTAGHLRILPGIDCYLNYAGDSFSRELSGVEEISITQDEEININNISLAEISRVLYKNSEDGASIITLRSDESSGSSLREMIHRLREDPSNESSSVRFRTSGKFRPNPNSSTTTPYTSPARRVGSENEPLIPKTPRIRQEEPPTPGFLTCLFCFCNVYCCPAETDPSESYEFATKEEVRCYVRMEHSREIKRSLDTLFDQSQVEWEKALKKLEEKENSKLQELAGKVVDKKKWEEMELIKKKDAENTATEGRLLPEDLKAKIKATREKQLQSKLRHDSEHSYKEGSHLIRQAAEMEREILSGNHNSSVLSSQFEILTNANYKYKAKLDRLLIKYFQRAARNV